MGLVFSSKPLFSGTRMNPKTVKIIVSNHAIDRLKQRFRVRFYKYIFDKEMTRNLIMAQVMNARVMESWKSVPFYVNKLGTKYGTGVEILYMSGVFYLCQYDAAKNILFVKTCTARTLNYSQDNL